MQQMQYPKANGLNLTKKEWESLSMQEQESIIKIIKNHKHEGFFTRWEVCGTENRKRIYCCGVCGKYKRDKDYNPYLFDDDA